MLCGIYKITNKVNGKLYIGQSKDIERRLKQHFSKNSNCRHLVRAIEKYGVDNFESAIVVLCNKDDLNYYERKLIELYDSMAHMGYNLTTGGDYDYSISEEVRERISNKVKEHWNKNRSHIIEILFNKETNERRRFSSINSRPENYAELQSARLRESYKDEQVYLRCLERLKKLRCNDDIERKRLENTRAYFSNVDNMNLVLERFKEARLKDSFEPKRLAGIKKFMQSPEYLEYIERMSEKAKERWSDAKFKDDQLKKMQSCLTENAIAERTEKIKLFWQTEEALEKKKILAESAVKNLSKSVVCIETGEVFSSIRCAAEWVNSILPNKTVHNIRTKISAVCVGHRKRCFGFSWKFHK